MLLPGSSTSPFASVPLDLKTDLAVRSNPMETTVESDVPDRKKRKRGGEEAVNGAPEATDAFREARYTSGPSSHPEAHGPD